MAGSGFAAPTSSGRDGDVEEPGESELRDELVAAGVHVGDEARQQAAVAQGPEGGRGVRVRGEVVGYLLYAEPYLAGCLEGDFDAAAPDDALLVLLEKGAPLGGAAASYVMDGVLAAHVGVGVRIAAQDALGREGDAELGAGLGLDLEAAGLEPGDGAVEVEEDGS